MLKEAKKWVAKLEKALEELSEAYGESVEALDAKFEDFYDNGGCDYDCGNGCGPYTNSVDAFYADYENKVADEEEELEDIYDKMREFAHQSGYTLTRQEFRDIRQQCEDEGDSIQDCSDEGLRELVEDWAPDHQV